MLTRTLGADLNADSPRRIGEWLVDPDANRLDRAGETVRVEPKVMEVLMALADRAGCVVGREELLQAVWPGVVVGDEVLTQAIIKLRRALGDNPRSPSYIETISKRGYRLIAPVGGVERPAPLSMPPAETTTPARRRRLPAAWALAAILLAVAAAGFALRSAVQPTRIAAAGDLAIGRDEASLTVAVAPFESLGSAPDQAYLARGISNDLLTDLARLPGLRLIRGYDTPPAQGARYVVSGSVQRAGDTLRINVHLTDTQTGQQLWSERFERPFTDLFAVQDELTRKVCEMLPGRLEAAAHQRRAKAYTRSLEAYDHFLRGQSLFLVRQPADNEQARAFYRRAIELDPRFARAYAGLAMTYAMDDRLQPSAGAAQALARAAQLAESARQIDPDIPEVHWAIGFVHAQGRRHEQAIESLRRAIELNRSYADAYALLGGIYTYVGAPDKSIPLLRTALRLDPQGGYLYFMLLGRAYLFQDDTEQALINLREAAARNAADVETRVYLAAALAAAGDIGAAEWEADEIRALQREFSMQRWLATYPLTDPGERARLLSLVARAGL
ncbi:MAG: winged helix-turn-helix domain-containing tetratricopeptide repeat protein [Pseudomonadota bacterium]